jgi:23S rRNA (guanosine2251-2'-O)-methyltransferase
LAAAKRLPRKPSRRSIAEAAAQSPFDDFNFVDSGRTNEFDLRPFRNVFLRDTLRSIFVMDRLTGIHAVREALEANRPLDSLLISKGTHGNRVEELVRLARKLDVPVRFEERAQVDRAAGTREHQGVVAFVASTPVKNFYDLLKPREEGSAPGLLVLLDGVEDPQNLGAIVRTSLAAGAQGVVIPERRAAGLTDAVARASAGALAHLPVARVTNLSRAMEEMKEAGYWLVGLDERAEQLHTEVDFKVPVGIVLGGEGKGLHALVRERCDFLVSIPTTGPVRALNVSVAAGVVLFEAVRQRRKTGK